MTYAPSRSDAHGSGRRGFSWPSALSGCASPTAQQHYAHGHEYFSQKKYGHASPKMIADGQPVPKGGGQYLVGHPYNVAGHTYVPSEMSSYTAVGMASWYGAAFHGRRTANGEVYDMGSITAAHPTMPLPSYARVTNLSNGYSVIVRVNDRGPYHGGRVMDVSSRAADVLGFQGRRHRQDQGRICRPGADGRFGRQRSARFAPHRRLAGPYRRLRRGDDGRREPARAVAVRRTVRIRKRAAATGPAACAAAPRAGRAPPVPEAVEVAAAEPRAGRPNPSGRRPCPRYASRTGPCRFRRRVRSTSGKPTACPGSLPPPPRSLPRTAVAVLPPRRPELQASAEKALYFTDASSDRVKRLTHGAFDKVKLSRAAAFDD